MKIKLDVFLEPIISFFPETFLGYTLAREQKYKSHK